MCENLDNNVLIKQHLCITYHNYYCIVSIFYRPVILAKKKKMFVYVSACGIKNVVKALQIPII